MRFADIPGHSDVKVRLRQMVDSERIPNALLLEGPSGIGKFALARATAQYIHCEQRTPDGDSCGKCPSCLQHQMFNHVDTIYSFPVVKKGDVSLSDDYLPEFRDMVKDTIFMDLDKWLLCLDNINAQPQIFVSEANALIRKLSFTTHKSKYKVVIMWLPERLKEDAANKLLKLVEEPHADTIFLMVSDNSRLILPTIFSRTQRIQVRRYADSEVSSYLQQAYSLQNDVATSVARLSAGNIAAAIKMIDVAQETNEFLEFFMELMRKAYTRKVADLKIWASNVASMGREREMRFLEYCAHMMRENFVLNMRQQALNFLNEAEMQFSSRFSPFINERNVERLIKVVDDARVDIAANANAKLVNFDMAIKVILLLKN